MKNVANNTDQERKVFSIINYLDFFDSQQIKYKNNNLKDSFSSVFFSIIKPIISNNEDAIISFVTNSSHNFTELKSLKEIQNTTKRINKHFLFGNKTDYRYLLIDEMFCLFQLLGLKIENDIQNTILGKMGFKEKEYPKVIQQIENIELIKDKRIANSFTDFRQFKKSLETYNAFKIVNIAVCATMSAGKSSFVNALLGYDYLPMRNEATTARVTSVYDNDNSNKLIGFTLQNQNVVTINNKLDPQVIDEWNSLDMVDRIVLQGDLDNIGNNGIIVTIHDTPGTNNSGEKDHHDITFDFLQKNQLNALIFVANAEHLCTIDEQQILKELHEKVVKKQNIPVIFIMNKADCIDTEKESVKELIQKYSEYLTNMGYKTPTILPVSAKAARLLKMASKNKDSEFTNKEIRAFSLCYDEFTNDYDFSSEEICLEKESKTITIGNNDYDLHNLLIALNRTGITSIEKEIERLF